MKFLLSFLLTFNVFAAQNAFNADGTVKTLHKKHLVVKNSAASALTVGRFVALDLTDDNGASVDLPSALGAPSLCMIIDTSCAVGALCKCQTYGFTESAFFGASGGTATTGAVGYATVTGEVVKFSTANPTDMPVGFFADASSASGAAQFFITLGGGE